MSSAAKHIRDYLLYKHIAIMDYSMPQRLTAARIMNIY